MWVIAGLLLTAGAIAAIEVPSLRGYKKDLWTFSLLLLLGTALSIFSALHVRIPNPLDWIAIVFQPLGESMRSFFEIRG